MSLLLSANFLTFKIRVISSFNLLAKNTKFNDFFPFTHLASASAALTIAHTATKTAGTPEIIN